MPNVYNSDIHTFGVISLLTFSCLAHNSKRFAINMRGIVHCTRVITLPSIHFKLPLPLAGDVCSEEQPILVCHPRHVLEGCNLEVDVSLIQIKFL